MGDKPKIHSKMFFNEWKRGKSDGFTRWLAYLFAYKSGPWRNELIQLLSANDLLALCNFSIDYSMVTDISTLSNARQCIALFTKNSDISIDVDRESVAWEAFAKSEIQCRSVNSRFEEYSSGGNTGYEQQLLFIRSKIAEILGKAPELSELSLGFGPGASSTVKKNTSARYKLNAEPVCSREAGESINELWPTIPHYAYLHKGKYRVGMGHLSFVPKSAKTDRSIMIEPLLNTFVQKGIGSYMKRRLLLAGCNLYDQSINKSLALKGSKDGSLATIDLSSASDSIASLVVLSVLPVDWMNLLCNWRTGLIVYDKKRLKIELEKFSSMGNGFTFELESLIFYVLALCVVIESGSAPAVFSVYGDDIIVPTECYSPLKNLLEFFGFSLNMEKSFNTGKFRESCGGDYYEGTDIRPFYVKGRWTDARVVGLLNFHLETGLLDASERDYIISHISPDHILYGPAGYGDGHIHGDHPRKPPANFNLSGYFFNSFSKVPKKNTSSLLFVGDDLYPLYNVMHSSPDPVAELFAPTGPGRAWVLCSPKRRRELLMNRAPLGSLEADPYVVRGDKGSKKSRIYVLNRGI